MLSRTKLGSCFSLLLLFATCLNVAGAKKLVIVAGPHETHTATNSFLSKYAADDGSGAASFDGWSWPIIENEDIDVSPQHVFDLLVKEQDDGGIQDILISAIRTAWTNSKHGVFLGSLDFDKVGVNPYSKHNAVEALSQVVDELEISTGDITVVVTYRTPRINQWHLVWKNHFNAESYENFVCSSEQTKKRWEWLDTALNPFKIAKEYHDQEWNVVIVDQESITKAGKDVPNAIACFAMGSENCENGRVNGIEKVTPEASAEDNIDELDTDNRNDLERMFLLRDCYYVTQLHDSSTFETLPKNSGFDSIQSECKNSLKNFYAKFSDTDFLMNAIQSQKYCDTDDIDVPTLLAQLSQSKIDESNADDEYIESDDDDDEDNNGPTDEPIDEPNDELTDEADDQADDDGDDDSGMPSSDDYESSPTSSSYNNTEKKLIVFVGPHETEAVDVTKFFVNYASRIGDVEDSNILSGWSWPFVDDEMISKPAHRTFDLLVTDSNEKKIQNVIIDEIVKTWKNSVNGVVMGSLDFDRVGINPYSKYDPIGALRRVVDVLGISNEDVTVTVTYRSPRIDHWSVVWNNHFDSNDYKAFICSDDEESTKRWEWLDTVMNPFNIAKKYHDQGWNVAVVDQEGTINAGMDVAHTIACNLMNDVKCKEGWVKGLEDAVSDPLTIIPMNSMDEDSRRDLEQLFQERDCYYKYQLKDQPGFQILNQHSAWSSCSGQHQSFYQQFTDTDFFLNLLKSQKQCGENDIDISNMLEKKMVHDHNKHLIVFAGPHETSAVPVTKFFVEHASHQEGTSRSNSFDGWAWPIIDSEILGNTESHRTFDLLLSDADTRPVQNIIMDGIRDSWNKVQNGVIIGSLDLDRVGENPYSSFDALGAVDRVVQALGISDHDVTVVLNYRSTRLDHLSAVWWNHFEAESFQGFICSDEQAEKRWEWMDTVMNPLKLANAYLEQGWNVAIIDEEGTAIAGKDVAHALACEVMNDVTCDRGWVRGLKNVTIDPPSSYQIDDLDDIQRAQFETLFHMRDCYYKYVLESESNFSTVNRNELWKSCSLKNKDKFEKLVTTDFFLDVMRSLLNCGEVSDVESSSFASDLSKSDTASTTRSHSSLVISTVLLSAIVITLLIILTNQRKRNKIHTAKDYPTEGIFREGPAFPSTGESSYRDNDADVVDETLYEESLDDNDGDDDEDNDVISGDERSTGDEEDVDDVEELDSTTIV